MRVVLVAVGLAVGALVAGGATAAVMGTPQTITVTVHAPATAGYEDAFSVTAQTSSGLPVSYSSGGSCSNSGPVFTMTSGTGTCLVKYDQPGDGTFDPAPQVVESVTAHKIDQTIILSAIADSEYGDQPFDVAAFATSDLDVAFTASGSCTITGVTVTIAGAGSCTVTASQSGDANYNPAPPASQTFAIAKADQAITFPDLEDKAVGDRDFTLRATADSGLAVEFAASGKCTVRAARLHITGAGHCAVTASQPGNANYNAAKSVSRSFVIAAAACSVPRVTGKRLAAARRTLVSNHCRTGRVRYAYSVKTRKGRVISQSRRAGLALPAGTRIGLVVSRGHR